MGTKPKDSTVIKRLEEKVTEARTILTSIRLMGLDDKFPVKLNEAIEKFLNSF